MFSLAIDLPAIYVPANADDHSLGPAFPIEQLDELMQEWPGGSLYFEPLGDRRAALLSALAQSAPALPAAVKEAASFLDLLPVDVPNPDIVVEDDGQIGLDWRVGDKSLSLNVGKGGMIGYSALFGPESAYGRAPFSNTELPPRIASLLSGLA